YCSSALGGGPGRYLHKARGGPGGVGAGAAGASDTRLVEKRHPLRHPRAGVPGVAEGCRKAKNPGFSGVLHVRLFYKADALTTAPREGGPHYPVAGAKRQAGRLAGRLAHVAVLVLLAATARAGVVAAHAFAAVADRLQLLVAGLVRDGGV